MITLLGKNPRGGGTKDGYIKDGPVWKHINSVRLHNGVKKINCHVFIGVSFPYH